MNKSLYYTLCLTFVLFGCSDRNKNDVDSVQTVLHAALKANFSKDKPLDIAGIWRSESTGSLLLVGTDQRVMILTVSDLGKVVETDKNHELIFEKSASPPPSGRLFFGTNVSGEIERVQYDYRELFHKLN